MLVAIEEAVLVTDATKYVDLFDSHEFEGNVVEDANGYGVQIVASTSDVELVKGNRNEGVDYHKALELPVGNKWDFVRFAMHSYFLAEVGGIKTQRIYYPMTKSPLALIGSPGRFHRILGVALFLHDVLVFLIMMKSGFVEKRIFASLYKAVGCFSTCHPNADCGVSVYGAWVWLVYKRLSR